MTRRLLALVASLAVAHPVLAQSRLLVVLKSGEVRSFELSEVDRIEFAGGIAPGGLPAIRPTYADPVGSWDWVDSQRLVVSASGRFDLHRADGTLISQGRWELLESASRRYRLVHSRGGYIDTLTLSDDGWELNGASNTGYRLQGRRRTDGDGTVDLGQQLPGTWDLADGRTLVFRTGGGVDAYSGTRKTDEGRWELLDAASRRFRMTWRLSSTVDTVVLASDGRSLEGTNGRGGRVSGRRR